MENKVEIKLPGLYGSEISPRKVIGYCKRHGKYLTVSMLKQHNCLGKQCNALDKHQHDYWTQREVLKNRKKEKRLQVTSYVRYE